MSALGLPGDGPVFAERAAACEALARWAENNARRDDLIRAAVEAGVSTREIQEIAGVARTTITRIMQHPADPVPSPRPR